MKIREHRNTKAWAVTHAHTELDSVTARHVLGDEFTETREHGDSWPAGRMITAFIRTTRFSSCVWYVLCACFCLSVCYTVLCDTRTCTHHLFNYPLSWTTRVSWYQSFSEWQWHQLGHMQVCTSLQTDNHASTPPLSFLQAGCPSCRPTNSVRALKAPCEMRLIRNVNLGAYHRLWFPVIAGAGRCWRSVDVATQTERADWATAERCQARGLTPCSRAFQFAIRIDSIRFVVVRIDSNRFVL